MTNAELVALLRESRDFMRQAAVARGPCPDCTECDRRDAIIAKADAALEAHAAAKSLPDDLKWEEMETNRYGISPHEADYSDSVFLTAEKHWLGEQWLWRVEYVGEAANEAEAKARAVEYARRLP